MQRVEMNWLTAIEWTIWGWQGVEGGRARLAAGNPAFVLLCARNGMDSAIPSC